MDSDINRKQSERILQAVRYHGHKLAQNVLEEHQHNPCMNFLDGNQLYHAASLHHGHVQSADLQGAKEHLTFINAQTDNREPGNFHARLCKFISTKADLIFGLEGKVQLRKGVDYGTEENPEAYDTFATVPPLEKFLGLDTQVKRRELFMTLQPGDLVTGRVVFKRPFGIIVKLMSMEHISRDFDDLECMALCRTTEMPNSREFPDPNDAYSVDDKVKAVVISTSPEEEQVFISFRPFRLPPQCSNVQLGTIEEGESNESSRDWKFIEGKTYNGHLEGQAGFANPRSVETLMEILGVNTDIPGSLLRGAQRSFSEDEYYEKLRRKQSSKWSLETTAKGVSLFKSGNTDNALKCFNHALEIDPSNVEALVAKGALNANQDRLTAAIQDFQGALSINPHHRNANKYLGETLVAQAKMFEEDSQLQKAAECYKAILEHDKVSEAGRLAAEQLHKIKEQIAAKEKLAESKIKNPVGVSRGASASAEKGQFSHVRQLIKEDKLFSKKLKKKQRKKKRQKHKSKHKKKGRKKSRKSSSSSETESNSESENEQEGIAGSSKWIEKTASNKASPTNSAPQVVEQKLGDSFDQTVGISQVLFWYESTQRNMPKKAVRGPLNKQDTDQLKESKGAADNVETTMQNKSCFIRSKDRGSRNSRKRKKVKGNKHERGKDKGDNSNSESSGSTSSDSRKPKKQRKKRFSHRRGDSSEGSDSSSSSSTDSISESKEGRVSNNRPKRKRQNSARSVSPSSSRSSSSDSRMKSRTKPRRQSSALKEGTVKNHGHKRKRGSDGRHVSQSSSDSTSNSSEADTEPRIKHSRSSASKEGATRLQRHKKHVEKTKRQVSGTYDNSRKRGLSYNSGEERVYSRSDKKRKSGDKMKEESHDHGNRRKSGDGK